MEETKSRIGKASKRLALTVLSCCLFLLAGLGLVGAAMSIFFGGLFERLAGWETVTGCSVAVATGILVLKKRPAYGELEKRRRLRGNCPEI